MSSVTELLHSRSCSDRLSVREGTTGEGVTWWEVADQADRWRTAGMEGPVGLALADPVAMAVNFVAALSAGVVVAPLDPSAPPADLAARTEQMALRGLVTTPGRPGPDGLTTWHAGRRELHLTRLGSPGLSALPERPRGVAALMASSGTTGRPKIVPLTENQLVATAMGVARELQLDPSDRGYSPLPLFHINGLVVGVLSALVAGSTILVERQFSRRSFWATVERRGATWLNLVPAILAILGSTECPAAASGGVRLARSASAPLPDAVRRRFETATGIAVIETYGMTEAASQITANPIGGSRPGSVGRPVDTEVRVVDGRVQIRGPRVTPVYWRAAGGRWSVRRAVDEEGWLDTGDIGRLDADGYLFLDGREGEVINRGGEKIQPREVEDILLSDRRVIAAVVVARPHPTVGEEPVAFVLPDPGTAVDPAELAADLECLAASRLSRFKLPAQIVVAESLPAGPTGKVRRAQVRAMVTAAPQIEPRL